MVSSKEKFAAWLIEKESPGYSAYFGTMDKAMSSLNEYNKFFEIDLFDENNIEGIKRVLNETFKNPGFEKTEFGKYSKKKQNHVPRAVLWNENYFKFLDQIRKSYLKTEHLTLLKKWGKVEYNKNSAEHQKIAEKYRELIIVLKKLFVVNNNDYRIHTLKWNDQAGRAKMRFADYIYVKIDKNKGRVTAGPLIIYAHLREDGLIMGIGFHDKNEKHNEEIADVVIKKLYRDIYPKIKNRHFKLKKDTVNENWEYFVNSVDIEELTPESIQEFISELIPYFEECEKIIKNNKKNH
jgi:hypothetical protein